MHIVFNMVVTLLIILIMSFVLTGPLVLAI